MNEQEHQIKLISNQLAIWEFTLSNLNSLSLYDANLFSEYSICRVLNCIFNINLQNVNLIESNFPAIDLGDFNNRIAFQITTQKSSRKIQETLNKFIKNDLGKNFDKIRIIILGKKQKRYSNIQVEPSLNFDIERDILDFRDLLSIIRLLPVKKLKLINKSLEETKPITSQDKTENASVTRFKKNFALSKKMQKAFYRKDDSYDFEDVYYEPWHKFLYNRVLICSYKNKKKREGIEESGISSLFKINVWDFYDNGIELTTVGSYVIIDSDGFWDFVDYNEVEKIKKDKSFKVEYLNKFLRIPYDYIVEYDMEPDEREGYPTIYVKYAKNGMPYEDILYGIRGSTENKIKTRYINFEKRKDNLKAPK